MGYTVKPLKEGFVKAEFFDEITEEDARNFSAAVNELLDPEKGEKQVEVLIDTSRADSKLTPGARRVLTDYNKNPLIGSHGVVGINRALRVMAIFVVRASRRDNIRFFDTEAEAMAWLEEVRRNRSK